MHDNESIEIFMRILADTSGLFALLDQNSSAHRRVYPYYAGLMVPTTVLTELDYMVTTRLGAHIVRDFYRGIESGFVTHVALEHRDLTRAFEIMDVYQDAEVGLTDASIVALAERYKLRRVLTLDRRHFSMFRPKGLEYLELLP